MLSGFGDTIYIGLLDVSGNELSGDTYQRIAVANDETVWRVNDDGSIANRTTLVFPMATRRWEDVDRLLLFRDQGNSKPIFLYLTHRMSIDIGSAIVINPGMIVVNT